MTAPRAGTAKDIRFTRSKDNTTLYAILLGWESGQKEMNLMTLASGKINLKNLKSVELINGAAGKYFPVAYKQSETGLLVTLPDRSFEDLAYVLKLTFNGKISKLDKYAILDCSPHYFLVPGDNTGSAVLGSDLTLTNKRKNPANQWKLESAGKGLYKILNREKNDFAFECSTAGHKLAIAHITGKDNQLWKMENSYNALIKISNKQFPEKILSVSSPIKEGAKAGFLASAKGASFGWKLLEVCEMKQEAFKPHTIPCSIEAEDFDTGCPGDAYFDRDDVNEGGQYRTGGVDIEKCSAGGYNVGWMRAGEWTAYTVTVSKPATYQVSFTIASSYDSGKFHLECDDTDKTGIISVPNTQGFQNWQVIKKNVTLDAGQHVLKLVVDGDLWNIDKMVFEETK